MDNLIEQARANDVQERLKKFQAGLNKLQEDTKIGLKPQISPDGPILLPVDLKPKDENKTDSQ